MSTSRAKDHLPGLASFHGGHSDFADGHGPLREYVQAAITRGLVAYGFSEHFVLPEIREYWPPGLPDSSWHMPPERVGEYVSAVRVLQSEFAGRIELLVATEIEYLPDRETWTREETGRWQFDYLVGAVHYVSFGDEMICIDWDKERVEEAARRAGSHELLCLRYYEHVLELLSWGLVRVLAHPDIIKMHAEPAATQSRRVRSKVIEVLELMRQQQVALDVNPRGLVKPTRAIYPADWILQEALRLGVPVTLGDDAHSPAEVGARLELAVQTLTRIGFKEMAIVRSGGRIELVPLPALS